MKNRNRIARAARYVYLKLCRINDTPVRLAAGFAVGVFLGIMPGMGIIAAIVLASLLRVNRAGAVLGALLTNTWLSVVTFVAAVKTGALLTGNNWHELYDSCKGIVTHFHWKDLFNLSFNDILFPLFIGYVYISLLAGFIAYLVVILIIRSLRRTRNRSH